MTDNDTRPATDDVTWDGGNAFQQRNIQIVELGRLLGERNKTIDDQRQQIAAQARRIEELEGALSRVNDKYFRETNENIKRDNTIDALQRDLNAAIARVGNAEAQVAERDREIAAKNVIIRERNEQLAGRDDNIAMLETDAAENERIGNNKWSMIIEKNAEIERLEQMLKARDARIVVESSRAEEYRKQLGLVDKAQPMEGDVEWSWHVTSELEDVFKTEAEARQMALNDVESGALISVLYRVQRVAAVRKVVQWSDKGGAQ